MNATLKTLLVAGLLAVALMAAPSTASADHNPYWRGYWGWYDNTYTPYYSYYGPTFYGSYGPSYNYGPGYGGYYTTPNYHYYSGYYAPGPNVNVRIGKGRDRVSFGWW